MTTKKIIPKLFLLLLISCLESLPTFAQEVNNLTIDRNACIVPPYQLIPYTQSGPIYFSGRIINTGTLTQTGTWISISVLDTVQQTIVHTGRLDFGGTIAPGDSSELLFFSPSFTHMGNGPASYVLTYEVGGDSTEVDMSDNFFNYAFEVSESTFAKSINPTVEITLDSSIFMPGMTQSWGMATYYYVNNGVDQWGTPLFATNATVGVANYEEMVGKDIIIWLYEWRDLNNDQVADLRLSSDETTIVGFNTYYFSGEETSPFLNVPLFDFNADPLDPCPPPPQLRSSTAYILMVDAAFGDPSESFIVLGDSIPQLESTKAFYDQFGTPQYSNGYRTQLARYLSFNTFISPDSTNFGDAIVPYLFFETGQAIIDNVEELSAEHLTRVYPNPASDRVYLNLDFASPVEEATLTLYNLQAQPLRQESYMNVTQQQLEWEVSAFPPGIYNLHIQTSEGSRTQMITLF